MRSFLIRQYLFLSTGAFLLVLLGLYTLPFVGYDLDLATLTRGATPILLLLSFLALFGVKPTSETPSERRFWILMRLAFGTWLGLEVLKLWAPQIIVKGSAAILSDSCYLAFFLLAWLAAEEIPGSSRFAGPAAIELSWTHRVGLVLFGFALLVYMVLIPERLNPTVYQTHLPSSLLYIILGALVGGRYLYIAQGVKRRRWRWIARAMGVSILLWWLIDLMDGIGRADLLTIPVGTYLDFLWFAPFLLTVAAFRLRFYRSRKNAEAISRVYLGLDLNPSRWQIRRELLVLPFLFPLIHFPGYHFGLLDQHSRDAREVTILLFALSVVGLALLNSTLSRTAQKLERSQRLASLGRLAGGVAHDFNNLLTVICAHSDLMLEELPQNHPRRKAIEEIARAGERASDLTQQLLTFSRQNPQEVRDIHPNVIIREMHGMFERLLGEQCQVVNHLTPELGQIRMDPGQFEQVIMNLVINARDAMAGRGEITLKTSRVENSMLPFPNPSAKHPQWIQLTVVDQGEGMSEATLSQIFEPFFTTKQVGRGTGLGLATVLGIVNQAGGHIRVETTLGRGTRFEIFLPCSQANPLEDDKLAAVAAPSSSAGWQTILLVEDDAMVRLVGRRILESRGYRVIEAENAETALDILSAQAAEIHLLISDVVMPGMSGPDMVHRALEAYPWLGVIFISGYPAKEFDQHPMSRRFPLISKPFSPADLSGKVEELLQIARTRSLQPDFERVNV